MIEEWRDAAGFELLYQVSSCGNVRSVDRYVKCNLGQRLVHGKQLKVCDRGNGYPFVTFGKNGKQYNISIHRIVAMTFLQNKHNYHEVNHKDENQFNSNANNLEWCDRKYNNIYNNRAKKVGEKRSKKVFQYKDGELVKIWNSLSEIKKEKNYSIGNISSCCNRKRREAHGYIWKYSKIETINQQKRKNEDK